MPDVRSKRFQNRPTAQVPSILHDIAWLGRKLLLILGPCVALVGCSDHPNTPPYEKHPRLTRFHSAPCWSADGESIYYLDEGIVEILPAGVRIDADSAGIRVIPTAGGSGALLLKILFTTFDLSPDDASIVYTKGGNIIVAALVDSATLGASTQITQAGSNLYPAWSADGEWIAFESDLDDPRGASVIWKVRRDGSDLADISMHGVGEWRMPDWNPVTDDIVHVRYTSDPTLPTEVFVMDSEGLNERRLTDDRRADFAPRFSPDGSMICYHSSSQDDIAVWVMNADGSAARRLVAGRDPCWSPDGTAIAFVATFDDPAKFGTVWTIDIESGTLKQLTSGRVN